MKVATWKKWMSFLYEIPVETVESKHSGYLTVLLKNGRYQLATDHAIYSFEDRYDNFLQAFQLIDRSRFFPSRILILGFGLGSIPIIMEKLKFSDMTFTAIDIDEEVFLLAKKYALPKINSQVEMVVTDAINFISQTNETWDLVISDIFIDDLIPEPFQQKSYLQLLHDIIQPDGLLLYNALAFNEDDRVNANAYYSTIFSKIFPKAVLLDVAHNYVFASNKKWYPSL